MYKKFCIILFVTIFYNGITYSSPTKEAVTEFVSKEKPAVPTVANTQINPKVEPITAATENGTSHIETPIVKSSPNSTETDDKNIHKNSTAVEKATGQNSDNKNTTQNIPATISQNLNGSVSGSTDNTTKPINQSTTAMPASATDLPPRNNSDMPRPTTAEPNTVTATTPAAGTSTKASTTKPTVVDPVTTPALSVSTDNASLEHNSQKNQDSGFHGASFVGGIVLTIGLTAIGFIAFKYYKSGKIDGNYRTL